MVGSDVLLSSSCPWVSVIVAGAVPSSNSMELGLVAAFAWAMAQRSVPVVLTSSIYSDQPRLRPLGLGRIQAIVPANSVGKRPQSTSGRPIMADRARFPRKAIERGA